jgi:SAM-dependent methyltransferase
MSESPEVLAAIRQKLRGKILLIGRKIGQSRLDALDASLRAEAKPHKYPTGASVLAWERDLLSRFAEGEFDSIVLHRFLYKPVKNYIEDPERILREVRRILPRGGVLVVNSYLLNDVTKDYRAAETFYTKQEMIDIIERQRFKKVSQLGVADALLFVCEN